LDKNDIEVLQGEPKMQTSIARLWPCINDKGLDLFAATADQRFLLGEELFLATHFPLSLRRFHPEDIVESVPEATILNQLLINRNNVRIGNRVFILYGAAGSGKSEMIRWLQLMMEQRSSHQPRDIIRIPRTDLDILHIIERFQHLLSKKYFTQATHVRWQDARRKPRTLAKLLLLTALERSMDSDELVNALYYRLLEWIQPRISRILNADATENGNETMPIEMLTREDLDQLKAETSLPTPLDYEQFRYHLLLAFREFLLEGINLPTVLTLISEDYAQKGERPLLLIDDLVQSINLFATDLLDYFITLENGNWDVVIGITPDAMSESKRGRELLDRITYLDTIDDRVVKLWLSDQSGSDSYFLSTENCAEFAALYLTAYRAQNGWRCDSCPNFPQCKALGTSNNYPHDILAPFNSILLRRIFMSLPENKGKARQYLLRLKQILSGFLQSQDLIATLIKIIPAEAAVNADDPLLARLAELYGPLPKNGKIPLSSTFLKSIGLPGKSVVLAAQPLQRVVEAPHIYQSRIKPLNNDPARVAIKSWLDGKEVNRQLLIGLRKGVAHWLRMTSYSMGFHAKGIASPHQVLQPSKVYLGVNPPILLEGVDEGQDGVIVDRSIGLNAFLFQELSLSQGTTKNSLLLQIAQSHESQRLIQKASGYHKQLQSSLENHLKMTLEEFALTFYIWAIVYRREQVEEIVPGIDYQKIKRLRKQRPLWVSFPRAELYDWAVWLFEDFFKLRENIFDGPRIAHYMAQSKKKWTFKKLESIKPETIDMDYYLGNLPFREALNSIKEIRAQIRNSSFMSDERYRLQNEVVQALNNTSRKGVALNQYPLFVWEGIERDRPDFFSTLRVVSKLS
jgi:hypothetical protein